MSGPIEVRLWGTLIGHAGYAPGSRIATFEYDASFASSGIQVSPILMPCPPLLHSFPEASFRSFKGLPGILADSLPDRFGSSLIDMFMAERGIPVDRVTALDRLLYVGARGMGALEYQPAASFGGSEPTGMALDLGLLASLADCVASGKREKAAELGKAGAVHQLIRIGSSAGGARSKALVARMQDGSFRDGTVDQGPDASYWIVKFDGSSNSDRDDSDPRGMPRVEYAYSSIARSCGIDMPKTDYLVDGEDFHFLVERFDRSVRNGRMAKLHYASWAGLAHADRDSTGSHSYEELVLLCRRLGLGQDAVTQVFRRAVFNLVGRNQDDHSKNFGFLMDKAGRWSLSPAFDKTYAFDPLGTWTRVHQIRLNGKQDGFTREDLLSFGRTCNLESKKANTIIGDVKAAFGAFARLARELDIPPELASTVQAALRMDL